MVAAVSGNNDPDGEVIVRTGTNSGNVVPTETVFRPAAEHLPSYNFIKKDKTSPEARRQQSEARREGLISQFMEQLRGKRTDSLADVSEDLSPTLLAELMRTAKQRLAEERKAQEIDEEERRAQFRKDLIERAKSVCNSCGLVIPFDPEGWKLDKHQESCAAYQEVVRRQQIKENRIRGYRNDLDRLLDKDISNAVSTINDTIKKIEQVSFDLNAAIYTADNPELLQAWKDFKQNINSLNDYERRRKLSLHYLERCSEFVQRVLAFYDKIEAEEAEQQEETE